MADSLFSSRNGYDPQLRDVDHTHGVMLLEALARRLSNLHGPVEASKAFYRIADICAGAHVMPLELLMQDAPKQAVPVPPRRDFERAAQLPPQKTSLVARIIDGFNAVSLLSFYVGLFCGWIAFGVM